MADGPIAQPSPPVRAGHVRGPLPFRARLQYLYLLRIPIVMGVGIFALPLVSLLWFPQLLGNLFVLDVWNIFWTMIATEMLAASILVVTRVVLLNGLERFGVRQGLTRDIVSGRALLMTEVLALPMFVAVVFSNGQAPDAYSILTRFAAALAGVVMAHIAAFLVLWLSILVSPQYPPPAGERFPMPLPFMRRWIDSAYAREMPWKDAKAELATTIKEWPRCMTAGYCDPHRNLPYPGQILSFGMLFLSYGLYQFIGYLKHARLGEPFGVPAMAYVIVLLIVINWMLSLAAFFLDRYRIPLLLPILLFVLGTNLISGSDHYYELRHAARALPGITPGEVLNAAARLSADKDHPNGRVTLIATAGGGIQSAAWTAQVLTGLQTAIQADSPDHSFASSIAEISSVSGGAVGAMFFVNQYQADTPNHGFPPNADLSGIVRTAEAGALGDVAWAMVYPDFTRVVLPFSKWEPNKLIDRGWALEQTWRTRGRLDATMGDWRQGVKDGWRPAVIFNSTIVESGEPLLLSTSDLGGKQIGGLGRKTLSAFLPGYDIPVVTAVRLAASFPFVSPAARAEWDRESAGGSSSGEDVLEKNSKYHVVDGGYYDNYGVNSLLEFLGEGLAATPKGKAPDILIIQIRSFPSEASSPEAKRRGWFYQSWAPLAALMRVRTTGQLVRDRESINNFVALWGGRGVNIRLATFEFQGYDAPLSWQMNSAQTKAIQDQWQEALHNSKENQDWIQVNCFFHPRAEECKNLPLEEKAAW